MTKRDLYEIDDELSVTRELLADTKAILARLTAPDYKPEDNPDDEFRKKDIEDAETEQVKLEVDEAILLDTIKKKWPDLYHLYDPTQ